MAIEFEKILNEQQLEAINIIDGPLVVYAGAGTGKTRTLTYRIANMIEKGIAPGNILAITFTKKATMEMQSRLVSLVGPFANMCTICTIHSLCAKILRHDIDKLDYEKNFTIIDDDDQLKVVSEVLDNLGFDKKEYPPKKVKKAIMNYKCFGYKPVFIPSFMRMYDAYEELNFSLNQLDFDDLLIKTHDLFVSFPEILEKYQEKYKYILVDEFQDTDTIQYQIISMLGEKYRNIFLVGDDDQSIYGFRGSNYENIKTFKAEYPEYKKVTLEQNYRSTQTILDGCNRLISVAQDREKKSLFSDIAGSPNDVEVVQAVDEHDEVNYVCRQIQSLVKSGYKYSDIAILYRLNSISRNFELGLNHEHIPFKLFGGIAYMARREIKDLSAYFRLALSPRDKWAFKRVVNVPSRGIGEKTIQKIMQYAQESHCSCFEAIDELKDELKTKYKVLEEFRDNVYELSGMVDSSNYLALYDEIMARFDFMKSIEGDDDEVDRKENIEEFKSLLMNLEDDGEVIDNRTRLQAYLDEALLNVGNFKGASSDTNYVTVSTVHQAKGLEFKAVFVVAFETGIFPAKRSNMEDIDIEEERRIAYVACTRAMKKLYLCCATRRTLYGSKITNSRSPFMIQFISGTKAKETVNRQNNTDKVDRTLPNNTNYQVGNKIVHKIYGEGIIVSLNGSIGTVCFTKANEIKTFDMNHPSIQKKD